MAAHADAIDESSTSTLYDAEHGAPAEKAAPDSDEKTGRFERQRSQVDVEYAEREFQQIRRQLSEASAMRRRSTKGTTQDDGDDEKGVHEDFDLLAYMRGQQSARDQQGFAHKEVGVTWQDLEVIGAGGMKIPIRTYPDAVKEFFMAPLMPILMRFFMKPKTLLHKFDGCAKPGEMVLVLGRPGSGCSTFLKAIANRREPYLAVNGDVKYAGIGHEMFKDRYRGEVVYNPEEDEHNATLTVAQTLLFALSLKTPAKRLPEETQKQFRQTVLNMMLKMLNIEHTADTIVGGMFLRGVSGGEKKRVSIAEMMTTRASVLSWDNSTRGLDASTALDFAKALRVLTDVFRTTTFVTLYQAGEGIWEQFDKVMVIDGGRQVYFGPRSEARQYFIDLGFEDLPRQTSADYVTGCTDENERHFAKGRNAENTPSDSEQLEKAYHDSKTYQRMMAEREAYAAQEANDAKHFEEFRRAVEEDKRKMVPKSSVYTVNFYHQVMAVTKRQILLKLGDRVALFVSIATTLFIAIIIGSCYFLLPVSASGAFNRGGLLFMALLFNAFGAFNELPTQMMGRPIMWRQAGYGMFRPAALSLGATLADQPFQILSIMVYCIIIYLMSGLVRNAGAFFQFYLLVYFGYMSLASFFRLLGCLCTNYDTAARLAATIVMVMVLYSGYVIPVYRMKRWLFWIYYISPLSYGFAGLMENEFGRIDLECDESYIVPHGPGYPDGLGQYQTCTLLGSQPGNPLVSGKDYIGESFQFYYDESWRNFGILIVFFVGFLVLQGIALEWLNHGQGMPAITVFQPENKERKELNEKLVENRIAFRKGEKEQDLSNLIETRKPFTWSALNYEVPVPGGRKRLLNDVFGYVKPGTLTALMGASGAGKTTLLDVLADRKTVGVVSGDILMNGRPIGKDFQRGTAYAEQQDEHQWTTTVREALRFSAYLRQPAHVSKEEKDAYCEEVLQLLELEDIADAMIGFPGYGLSMEARKRLTIGVELASKPQLLLFLDEPTTGLDGQSAYNLVRFLRKLAAAGQAILCTIHQPNALLFENFDRLLLLKKGGRTVYFGPIGKDSVHVRDYLAAHGAVCPPTANPAEYMLEAIGAGSTRRVGDRDWGDIWATSKELDLTKQEIAKINTDAQNQPTDVDAEIEKEFATPFLTQLRIVSHRTIIAFWRMPDYGFTRLFIHISIALATSLTFLQLGAHLADLQYRVFCLFVATVLPAMMYVFQRHVPSRSDLNKLSIITVEPTFIFGRQTFVREASSKMYGTIVFALSQLIAEMPNTVLCATIYFVLFYYPVAFNAASDRAIYFWLMLIFVETWAVTLGQAVASLSPTLLVAVYINPFLIIMMVMFCGVRCTRVVQAVLFVANEDSSNPFPQIPHFWRSWMYYLDPMTRLIGGLTVNELYNLEITCFDYEYSIVQPPPGQTCGGYLTNYTQAVSGYINNPSATSDCQYCQYATGQQFYTPLNLDWGNRWRDLGIMAAFAVFNGILNRYFGHEIPYIQIYQALRLQT